MLLLGSLQAPAGGGYSRTKGLEGSREGPLVPLLPAPSGCALASGTILAALRYPHGRHPVGRPRGHGLQNLPAADPMDGGAWPGSPGTPSPDSGLTFRTQHPTPQSGLHFCNQSSIQRPHGSYGPPRVLSYSEEGCWGPLGQHWGWWGKSPGWDAGKLGPDQVARPVAWVHIRPGLPCAVWLWAGSGLGLSEPRPLIWETRLTPVPAGLRRLEQGYRQGQAQELGGGPC